LFPIVSVSPSPQDLASLPSEYDEWLRGVQQPRPLVTQRVLQSAEGAAAAAAAAAAAGGGVQQQQEGGSGDRSTGTGFHFVDGNRVVYGAAAAAAGNAGRRAARQEEEGGEEAVSPERPARPARAAGGRALPLPLARLAPGLGARPKATAGPQVAKGAGVRRFPSRFATDGAAAREEVPPAPRPQEPEDVESEDGAGPSSGDEGDDDVVVLDGPLPPLRVVWGAPLVPVRGGGGRGAGVRDRASSESEGGEVRVLEGGGDGGEGEGRRLSGAGVGPKRKRGVAAEEQEEPGNMGDEAPPPKRGRGRPPKRAEAGEEEEGNVPLSLSPKRGRGRPRKHPLPPPAPVPPAARPAWQPIAALAAVASAATPRKAAAAAARPVAPAPAVAAAAAAAAAAAEEEDEVVVVTDNEDGPAAGLVASPARASRRLHQRRLAGRVDEEGWQVLDEAVLRALEAVDVDLTMDDDD
jgi:hypothetical protein